MNTTVSLSPAEGLIVRHLSFWVGIATQGKGGSRDHLGRGWTYLAAWDIQERIQAEDHVVLSEPTIYRALKRLVAIGWFVREKLNAGRYRDQTYHYTFGPSHPSVVRGGTCTEEAPDLAPSPAKNRNHHSDQTEVVTVITSKLSTPPLSPPNKTKATESPAAEKTEIDREESQEQPSEQKCVETAAAVTQAVFEEASTGLRAEVPAQPVQASVQLSERALVTPGEPPATPRRHLGLSGILARCLQIGGYNSWDEVPQPETVSPKAIIRRDGTRLEVDDGATAPLR